MGAKKCRPVIRKELDQLFRESKFRTDCSLSTSESLGRDAEFIPGVRRKAICGVPLARAHRCRQLRSDLRIEALGMNLPGVNGLTCRVAFDAVYVGLSDLGCSQTVHRVHLQGNKGLRHPGRTDNIHPHSVVL
jgi:hypothetical protein